MNFKGQILYKSKDNLDCAVKCSENFKNTFKEADHVFR